MATEIFKHKTLKSLMKCVKTLFDMAIITSSPEKKKEENVKIHHQSV